MTRSAPRSLESASFRNEAFTVRARGMALAAGLLAAHGCSAGPEGEASPPPTFQGTLGSESGSGSSEPGGSPGTNDGASSGTGGAGGGDLAGGTAPGSGGSANGESPPTASGIDGDGGNDDPGGQAPAAGNDDANAGAGGSMMGSGGGAMVGGAGASMDPDPVDADPVDPDPVDPDPVDPDPVDPGPATPDISCPADATFCSGFEGNALPAGVSWEPAYERFQLGNQASLDTAVVHSGQQSISVGSSGNYSYRMLTVPVPGATFWVRLYMQSDSVFGDNSHDTPFLASALPAGQYNGDSATEFSEQGNQVLLNQNDQLYSANGPGFPQGGGPTLPAGTWICMEALFDGASGNVEIYADGDLLISAPGYNQVNYQTFRFGYLSFNDARTFWYDDVVVAASRVGCN